MPNADDWKEFDLIKGEQVKWMIYEDEPIPEIRAEIERRGVGVIVFRPCGNRPPAGDFLTEMRANIERLQVIYHRDSEFFLWFLLLWQRRSC